MSPERPGREGEGEGEGGKEREGEREVRPPPPPAAPAGSNGILLRGEVDGRNER